MRKTYPTPQGGPTEIAAEMPDCAGRNGVHDPAKWRLVYTPQANGPKAVRRQWTIYGSYNSVVAITGHPSRYAEANARLIAAAPELLDACRQALGCDLDPATNALIRAAITKAEGRSDA